MPGTCYPCCPYMLPSLFEVRGNIRRLEPLAEVWVLNKFCRCGVEKAASGKTAVEKKHLDVGSNRD